MRRFGFNKPETILLPKTVVPAVPIVLDTIAVRVAFSNWRPKHAVIPANIATCSGIRTAASENGIGTAPVAAAAEAAATTTACAFSIFNSKFTDWIATNVFLQYLEWHYSSL